MLSLRRAGRGPLARLVAHVLIAAFVVTLLPAPAQAAFPSVPGVPAALPDLPLSGSVPAVLLVAVAIADGSPCTVLIAVATPSDPINYHRARWMDPRVGRFVGMDPFEGLEHEPLTLHRYLYAGADPVNKVDPSGRDFSLGAQITIGAMLGAIANIAIVQPRGVRQTVETALLGAAAGAAGVATGSAFVALYLRFVAAGGAIITAGGIAVLPHRLQHVLDGHTWGGIQSAGRSVFWAGTNLIDLVRQGASTPAVQQANGNFARFVYAGYQVGIDRFTGTATSIYTIITSPTGQLVTMFPGLPR